MNNEQQEIERMCLIMAKNTPTFSPTTNEMLLKTAKKLSNAGIGDKKKAVKEAFEKLKDNIKSEISTTSPLDLYIGGKNSACKTTLTKIDELFTELYGADE